MPTPFVAELTWALGGQTIKQSQRPESPHHCHLGCGKQKEQLILTYHGFSSVFLPNACANSATVGIAIAVNAGVPMQVAHLMALRAECGTTSGAVLTA